MTTVIFVHGTGGRKEAYAVTFGHIEDTLKERKPDIKLVPCLWGEPHGTKLNAGGVSIPDYDLTGGTTNSNDKEDDRVQLWEKLYKDPLYEIRLLSLRPIRGQAAVPGKLTPSQELRNRVKQLTASETLRIQLEKARIAEVFDPAHKAVTESSPYARLLETASRPLDEDYAAIARAIVAEAIELCDRQYINTPIQFDADLRDQTVDSINRELTNDTQSRGVIGNWMKSQFLKGLNELGDKYFLQRKRGSLTNAAYPFSGDILYYQAKGKKIRDFIRKQVENVEPPVVLLAHSLGGIACVDLLVEHKLEQVKLLVTVGSQAPFLYEINALQSLSYGESIPEHFPKKWLNIYDLRDVLSYVGEGLFPGKIIDVKVDNQQPFPESHGAYWYNSATWDAILQELP
jgi:hypothetical protein